MSVSSTFVCALSGSVPSVPVVARTSGLLFERHLIEQHLQLAGHVCPVTQQPLVPADLLPLVSAAGAQSNGMVKPRSASATSIPGLLSLLQSEWDAAMLESFHLKQQCESLKQDLAHALYKEDAANRVIARLIKERDTARNALMHTEQNISRAAANNTGDLATDVDESKKASAAAAATAAGALSASTLELLVTTSAALSKTRKAAVKDAAACVAAAADVQALRVLDKSHPLHATTNPGILAVDQSRTNPDLIVTGGNDGKAIVFQRSTGKIAAHLAGHKSAVTSVQFHPTKDSVLFTASADHSAQAWRHDGASKWSAVQHFGGAKDALTSLSVHASGDLLATGSKDASWTLFDVSSGDELRRTACGDAVSSMSFHPDGVLLGAAGAKDGVVRIFDVKTCSVAAELRSQYTHTAGATAFTFSENGFHCATAEASGIVKLWDLRKLANFHTLHLTAQDGDKAGTFVSALAFDASSTYLAAAVGSRALIHACKSWEEVIQLSEHKDRVTGFVWGSQARTCVTVGMDRQLKLWA